jgi:hypothetical protein
LERSFFFLADCDHVRHEVKVIDVGAKHLAASCPGVGGEGKHGVDETMAACMADVSQKLVNLGQRQEERVPKLLLLLLR